MLKIFSIFAIAFVLISCNNYSNLYSVNNTNESIKEDNFFFFENDTIKITYSFWADKGYLSFTFYNKLNIPVYIDWKKSSIVKNDSKFNYWVDETKVKSRSIGANYSSLIYGGSTALYSLGSVTSESTLIKPERITFISPKSSVTRVEKNLFNLKPENVSINAKKEKLKCNDGKTLTSVVSDYFNMENTPFRFRNFITYSLTEKFDSEYYVDNGFYVNKISKIKRNKIVPVSTVDYKTGKNKISYPYSSPTQFFIKKLPIQ